MFWVGYWLGFGNDKKDQLLDVFYIVIHLLFINVVIYFVIKMMSDACYM